MCVQCEGIAPKIFCNGIEKIELIGGGCARFTLYENRASDTGGHRRPTGEIIVPLSALPHMIRQATACLVWSDGDSPEADLIAMALH